MDNEPGEVSVAAKAHPIYTRNELGEELRQGEIISNLSQFVYYSPEDQEIIQHDFSIVLTQDCDLLWDYKNRRGGGGGTLSSVLLYPAEPAQEARARVPPGREIWKRITQNNDERYNLLESVSADLDTANQGIGSLLVDFKAFFALTPQDIYAQCATGQAIRRCRLEVPYREHLQCRAAFYFQRVTLPVPHRFE